MDLRKSNARDSLWIRLQALKGSGGGVHAASLRPASIVSAVRMLLDLYPRRFQTDADLRQRLLKAFVLTVIPGADPASPNLIRMYHDTDYPFHPYSGYLVNDLAHRSMRLFGDEAFDLLDLPRRTSVVEDALASDDTTSRLYRGAVLMAQVSYFAGIYDPDRGCPLIDFPGRNRGFGAKELTYPDGAKYLGAELTTDGNPP
jgi:hypothetical protein